MNAIMIKYKSILATKEIKQIEVNSLLRHMNKKLSLEERFIFYEYIDGPCKFYIDYDKKSKKSSFEEDRKNAFDEIREKVIDLDYHLFESCGFSQTKKEWKISFRIISYNIYFEQGLDMVNYAKSFNLSGLDLSVYKSKKKMQLLRVPYATKEGENRPLKYIDEDYKIIEFKDIDEDNFGDLFVTNIEGCELYNDFNLEGEESSDEEVCFDDDEENDDGELQKALTKKMPNTKLSGKNTYDDAKNTKIYGLSKSSDKCPICRRVHSSNRNYIILYKSNSNYYIKCHDEDAKNKRLLILEYKEQKAYIQQEENNMDHLPLFSDIYALLYHTENEGSLTDMCLAELFIKYIEGDLLIESYNNGYYWYNGAWKYLKSDSIACLIPDFFNEALLECFSRIGNTIDNLTGDPKMKYHCMIKKNLQNTIKSIGSSTRTKSICKFICNEMSKLYIGDKDIFDNNPNLLGFNNGVFDLESNEFRSIKKEDYITYSCGYDYRLPEPEETAIWKEYINKVMPVECEREFFMKVLSSCLRGETVENLFLFIGSGRNSKDTLITTLLKDIMGYDYYYQAQNTVLTTSIKEGANPQIVSMHKKRVVVINEPEKMNNIKASAIKLLTGSSEINSRGLYSSNCKVKVNATIISLLNAIPSIDGMDEAVAIRLRAIPFRAQFLTEEDLVKLPKDVQYVHSVSAYYKSKDFVQSVKYAMLANMIFAYKSFKDESYVIRGSPQSILDLTSEYIEEADEFIQWFQEKYEYVDDENEFVQFKDMFALYKRSDLWINMPKGEKRKMTKKKMMKDILSKPSIKHFYKDRMQISGVRHRGIIIKYRRILEDEGEEEIVYDLVEGEADKALFSDDE